MKPIYLVICFGIIMLVCMPFIKADSLGVTHQYNSALQKYEIYQWFGLEKVADVHLLSNTEGCLTDCEATIKIEPYISFGTNDNPNDYDWTFLDILSNEQSVDYHIFNLFHWTENVSIPETECEEIESINGTIELNCTTTYEIEEIEKQEFMEIDFYNFEFQIGEEYILKLQGKKPVNLAIEWVPTFYSVNLNQWAWWNASCDYRMELNVTENNATALINYPVNATITATANFDTSNKTYVVMDDTTQVNFYFNDTTFTNGNQYLLWWNTNVSASATEHDYLYYACSGAQAEANVSSYAVNGSTDSYWHFNDNYLDSSGNSHTLAPAGNPAFTTGKYSTGAIDLDGDDELNDAISYPSATEFSIEVWVKPNINYDSTTGIRAFVSHMDASQANDYSGWWLAHWGSSDNGHIGLGIGYDNTFCNALTATYDMTAGVWYHLIGTYDGTTTKIYINGVLEASANCPTYETGTAQKFTVGARRYSDDTAALFCNAIFDEVRYLNNGLDASRIVPRAIEPTIVVGSEEQTTEVIAALIIPADNTNVTTALNNFSCNATATAVTLNNLTLYIWNSSHSAIATNVTTITGTFDEASWMINLPYDDNYLWNCLVQDTTGSQIDWATNRTIRYDSVSPEVYITSPETDDIFVNKAIDFNYTTTETNPGACWYNLHNGSGNVTLSSCVANTTITVLDNTNYALDFYANDSFGHENSTSVDFTVVNLTINEAYPSTAIETSSQNFGITIEKNSSVTALSWIWFNNTKYSSPDSSTTGTNTTYNQSITMPIVETDPTSKDSIWNFNITFGTRTTPLNATTHATSISQMTMNIDCVNATSVINYTFREESNNSQINGTADIAVTFWKSLVSLNRTSNFTVAETNTFVVCANGTYYTDAYLVSTSAFKNESYVQKSHRLLNATLNISSLAYDYLYMLPTSDSTSILIKLLDEGYAPLENHYIKVQRYYVDEDAYKTIEILKTDENGYAVSHLEEEDVDYKFIIQDYTTVLKTTPSMRVFCLESPCTLEIRVFEEEDPYQYLIPDNLYINLSYTNDTKTISFEFTEPTGLSRTATLTVFSKGTRGDTLVCNTSQTTSSGTLNCDLSGRSEETFYTTIYWDGHFVGNLWTSITSTFTTFGDEGLIFMVIIMTCLAMIGIWNPVVSLVLMFAGFIFMLVTGIAYVVPAVVAAVAIIIILAIKYLNT